MAQEKPIDFYELWQEKIFLGEEFLTWLWLRSEMGDPFATDDGTALGIRFENSLRLGIGQGPGKKSVTCQDSARDITPEWPEAFTAVARNKKVKSGRLRIKSGEREWSLTLPHDTLGPKSVKLMAGADFRDEDDGQTTQAGALLDRMVFFIELSGIIESLLGAFLRLRLSPEWESEELPRLRAWVSGWARDDG
jgi:recombination associated protein RdgC